MLKYFFLLFFAVFPFSSLSAEGIVLQEEECEKKIIELIEQSKEYIDVSVYSINNKKLVDALIRAHRRGIKLRVLTDKVQAAGKSSKIWDLIAAGVPLRVHTHKRIMHTKVAIYDGKSVSSGSFNWTDSAVERNHEICNFFIDDPAYAAQHRQLFDRFWRENPQDKSDRWLRLRGRCGDILLLRT